MIRQELPIINKLGLHARAAAKFVRCASAFGSTILVERNGSQVNGKSIMGVMMLAASQGTTITCEAEGEDEAEAIATLAALVADRFEEQE